jgi:acylphosphatase
MRAAGFHIAFLFAAILASASVFSSAGAKDVSQEAITATVSGGAIQKVGFRAMIQKEAIMYNLAGFAKNNSDGTVAVSLQGDKDRIDKTLEDIRVGTKKSSTDNKVNPAPAAVDPALKTFTVYGWTSTTRNISNPYDLVFTLRPANNKISRQEAKDVWNTIAQGTLKGDDLAKFNKHLEDEGD